MLWLYDPMEKERKHLKGAQIFGISQSPKPEIALVSEHSLVSRKVPRPSCHLWPVLARELQRSCICVSAVSVTQGWGAPCQHDWTLSGILLLSLAPLSTTDNSLARPPSLRGSRSCLPCHLASPTRAPKCHKIGLWVSCSVGCLNIPA